MIDWQNRDSVWFAMPSNAQLMPGGSEYHRYEWVREQIERGSRVLDVGCNCGQLAVNLCKDLECQVVGVDIVAEFIQHCQREKGAYGSFYQADFSRMGGELFERAGLWGSFEVVTALEVIEHPIYVRGFLENVKRALKPGGKLVITTPHPESPAFGYRYLESHPHHVRMWTPLRLAMVFGPGGTYSEIEREGKLAQIGAVFVWDGWDHPDSDPVADLASWTAEVKRPGDGE